MHFSPLVLLAMATMALALPTTNDTTDASVLEKRSSRPWLDSFGLNDASCKDSDGSTAEDYRPFIQAGKCVAFQPEESRLGGSWGAGKYSLKSFWAFENDDCTGKVKAKINRKGGEHGFCFSVDSLGCQAGDVDNPCFWNSVRENKYT